MDFEKKLNGKILDPIHGIIRVTDIEKKIINHPLFQRLRNVKQNTFLYKVFPSAMHSRFEHSLGVMHFSYRMLNNLVINSYRYDNKYKDEYLFKNINIIPDVNIQELRLAALLHDIGHGPMSHQFDSFMLTKSQLIEFLGSDFDDVYELIKKEDSVEHEHISLIFISKIFNDLGLGDEVSVDNVMKIIESGYKDSEIMVSIDGVTFNLLPLFTSLISSCPIDSDRMDYLLRDSYFSGVKCGVYNVDRILMSIIPIHERDSVFLAYKESSLDSISEFIFSRENLFSQVYYHKTNRSFSAMLSKVCSYAKSKASAHLATDLYKLEPEYKELNLKLLSDFYLDNSDDYFINNTLPELIAGDVVVEGIINDIVERKPWKKIYESKVYLSNESISTPVNKEFINEVRSKIEKTLSTVLNDDAFIVDIMSDNAFKDVDKTEVKLLSKKVDGSYQYNSVEKCHEKLDIYQSIKYFIRVYVNPKLISNEVLKLRESIEEQKNILEQKLREPKK